MKYIVVFLFLMLPLAVQAQQTVTLEVVDGRGAADEAGLVAGAIRISRTDSTGVLVVNVTFEGSSTASTADYSTNDGGTISVFNTVTLSPGVMSREIEFIPRADNLVEGQEQVDLSLAAGSGYLIGTQATASITIDDDPPIVTLEASDESGDEEGQDPFAFVARREGGNLAQSLTVNITIDPDNTAATNGDFSGNDGGTLQVFQTITIFGGNAEREILFLPTLDNVIEPTETFSISLAAGSYLASGAPNVASATIADDPPVVTLEASDTSGDEEGQDPFAFVARRTGGNLAQSLTVNITIDPSSTAATNGDFSGNDGGTLQVFQTITIFGGNAEREILFLPTLDNLVEPTETFTISLAAGSYLMAAAPNTASATIVDDPPVITLEASDMAADEEGQDPFAFVARRSGGNPAQSLTVNITIDPDNTAATNGDFSGNDGGTLQVFQTITIFGGSTEREILFTPTLDNVVEEAETFSISLAAGSYLMSAAPNVASATIEDDPPVVTLTAPDNFATEEGNQGTFRFSRTGGNIAVNLTVNVGLAADNTVQTGEYSSDDGGTLSVFNQATIFANQTSRDIVITALPDGPEDDDELLSLEIAAGSYVIGSPGGAAIVFLGDLIYKDGLEPDN